MSSHVSVARTTPPAPPALRSATLIAPRLLPVCCVCGLIRDEARPSLDGERWVSPRTYRQTHGVLLTKLALTHTYCPECFTKAQETMQQYFREIRSAAMSRLADSPNVGGAAPPQAADLAPHTQSPAYR